MPNLPPLAGPSDCLNSLISKEIMRLPPEKRSLLLNRSKRELQGEFWEFAKRPWLERLFRAEIISKDNREGSHRGSPDYFNNFIYLWVVFNSWLSICASEDLPDPEQDTSLVSAAACDQILTERFDKLKLSGDFHEFSVHFAKLWPIFKARTIVDKGIKPWTSVSRQTFVDETVTTLRTMFGDNIRKHISPACYERHINSEQSSFGAIWQGPPNDWPHTLRAIYQVRCNLFHGGKSYRSSKDMEFVRLSFELLWRVWKPEIPEGIEKQLLARAERVRER
jgi:hypothetical protein